MVQEFYPHPDEFNLGYQSSRKEEKKKKKRWKLVSRLKTFMFSVLLIMPLTIGIGLWDMNSFEFGLKTLKSGNSYVHFEENGGWFFNGRYFVPMQWDQKKGTYQASGAYPGDNGYLVVSCSGDLEVSGRGVTMQDPFSQKPGLYRDTTFSFNTAYIDEYNQDRFTLSGKWQGTVEPDYPYPYAYPVAVEISGLQGVIIVGNTENSNIVSYPVTLVREGSHITLIPEQEIEYVVSTAEREIRFIMKDPVEAILYITEEGIYLATNIFADQIFVKR